MFGQKVSKSLRSRVVLEAYSADTSNILTMEDLQEINNLYYEFIHRYNKLNSLFGYNNPVQIYSMFNYLLYKGYLSIDKVYTSDCKDIREISPVYKNKINGIEIMGVNILNGNGVCRHTASMLKDILNDYGLETYILTCCLYGDKTSMVEKIFGNHTICFTEDKNYSYFLDSLILCIYSLRKHGSKLLYAQEIETKEQYFLKVKIKNNSSFLTFREDGYALREKLKSIKPNLSSEELKGIVQDTMNICVKNDDIFNEFYNDNCELFEEVSFKLEKVKTNSLR